MQRTLEFVAPSSIYPLSEVVASFLRKELRILCYMEANQLLAMTDGTDSIFLSQRENLPRKQDISENIIRSTSTNGRQYD